MAAASAEAGAAALPAAASAALPAAAGKQFNPHSIPANRNEHESRRLPELAAFLMPIIQRSSTYSFKS